MSSFNSFTQQVLDEAIEKAITHFQEKLPSSRSVAIVYLETRIRELSKECFPNTSQREVVEVTVIETAEDLIEHFGKPNPNEDAQLTQFARELELGELGVVRVEEKREPQDT